MKFNYLLIALLLSTCSLLAQNKYGYPVDNSTGKVTFDSSITIASVNKERLFKRAQQFVAVQNFEETAEIKTKGKGSFRGRVVDKAISYQDLEEGKLFGNGYAPFKYRKYEYFVITFSYKIYVKDNEYRYKFSDFDVLEFIHAGKSRATLGYGMSGSKTLNSDAEIRHYPIEKFMNKSAYERSDDDFLNAVNHLKDQLSKAMNGEL